MMLVQLREKSLFDRWLDSIEFRKPNECWNWIAGRHSFGYGIINAHQRRGNQMYAHRLSMIFFTENSIPDKKQVLHSCDNPSCVNPSHLYIGTQKENVQDSVRRHRHRTTKLTIKQIFHIRSSSTISVELAKRFHVHESTIGNVRRGVTWKWF